MAEIYIAQAASAIRPPHSGVVVGVGFVNCILCNRILKFSWKSLNGGGDMIFKHVVQTCRLCNLEQRLQDKPRSSLHLN